MNKRPLNTRLISIVQMLFVLGGYLLSTDLIWRRTDIWDIWLLVHIFPIFATMLASFVICLLAGAQISYRDAIWISMPSVLLYFFLEALLPFLQWFDFFYLADVCDRDLPFTLGSLLLFSFATWFGSWAHRKIFRRNIINTKI